MNQQTQDTTNKPIMHIKVSEKLGYINGKRLTQTLQKFYSDKFVLITTGKSVELTADNMVVIDVHEDTNIDDFICKIENFYIKTTQEV